MFNIFDYLPPEGFGVPLGFGVETGFGLLVVLGVGVGVGIILSFLFHIYIRQNKKPLTLIS
jgi:hypothetical protein